MSIQKLGAALAAVAVFGALSTNAAAAEWPGAKPITMIIPYAAGGFADTRMRMLGEELAKELKANVVIENKAGAGGVIGTAEIARAKPDGYTIGSGHLAPLSVNPTLMPKNVPYDVQKDLTPVILIEEAPLILNVNKKVPVNSIAELIDLSKKDPGRITFGSSGVGGAHHLSGELFANS